MFTLPIIFIVGFAGALLFTLLKFPGGAMTGAMIAVVLFKTFSTLPSVEVPDGARLLIYTCVGIVVGNMYKPEMLKILVQTWPALVISTAVILLAGCFCTWIVARSGALSVSSAYLATSPGGFNAIMGLSIAHDEAPIVMLYHIVRIYAIILLAPYISRFLGLLMK